MPHQLYFDPATLDPTRQKQIIEQSGTGFNLSHDPATPWHANIEFKKERTQVRNVGCIQINNIWACEYHVVNSEKCLSFSEVM